MELPAGCTDRPAVRERFHRLTDAFRCFQTGSRPRNSAADVAGVMFSGVSGLPGEDRCSPRRHCCDRRSAELTCISVTLVEKITCSLSAQSLPPAAAAYYEEIIRVLFQEMDLMSRLVRLFQAEDQIISHLTAKSVSTCVFYHLHKCGKVSPVWKQKCLETFHNSPPGTELDACLWSLTEVLKRLLKGAHQEILRKLLGAFDPHLSALCSKFLPEERKDQAECGSRHWGTTFCLLLDLMEVLTASGLICGATVCLKSQSLTYIHSSALLTTVSCSSEYYVKKRVLLLLKRAVLQKSGEDWALGDVPCTRLKYEHFNSDMNLLAQSVLTAVATNWLQCVQVDCASFFGGTRHIRADERQKPDCVMLRAVSLLLLKSMELHIQTASEPAGGDSATEVYGYLQCLWVFLKSYSVQLMEVTHLCCWVSLLFGEQDDDMMDAAKALLLVFLHHRQCSGLEGVAVVEAACASGCNPHCHFLLLLQSLSFDHSTLLDFLISTETCFLEYFVRYLKYLRSDWQGFTAACRRMSVSDCHLSLHKSQTTSYSGVGGQFALTSEGELDRVESSSCVKPTYAVSPVEMISLAGGLRLVDYDSSEESDSENMDSTDAPGTSGCENSRVDALDVKQEIRRKTVPIRQNQSESSCSTTLQSHSYSTRTEGTLVPLLQSEQTSCPEMGPLSGQVTCETSARAVHCLSELRELVTRLQAKKLFPYNPSSLLKLLAQV